MILKYILLIIYVTDVILLSRNFFLFFQLDSYQFPSFFRTIKRNVKYCLIPSLVLTFIFLIETFLLPGFNIYLKILINIIITIILYYFRRNINITNAKKDLVYTNRLKRLYLFYFVFLYLIAYILYDYNLIFILGLFALIIFNLSALAAWPVEKIINEYYFNLARKKLNSMNNLIKIGITGSYGKTSTKNIMGAIINSYIPTLVSPLSYNTPMGLTKTIRNMLTPSYRVFIAEMGSRHIGDINKLCKLVYPQIGVITSVGPQHLDTFGTVDNVKKGKYELIENLPCKTGYAFFQDDRGIVRDLFNITNNINKTLVSIYDSNADLYISDIKIGANGSTFTVNFKDNSSFECSTTLLGENNIKNIAISIAVAKLLNVPDSLIIKSISELKPTKSRLELINAGKYTIINDAFNSNTVGSREALNILSKFEKRKIIITPGMVELGDQENKLNYELGQEIAKVVDIAILVGKKRIVPIKKGIVDSGFDEKNIFVVDSLNDSTSILNSIVQEGDVVLYENDLPDNYIDA